MRARARARARARVRARVRVRSSREIAPTAAVWVPSPVGTRRRPAAPSTLAQSAACIRHS